MKKLIFFLIFIFPFNAFAEFAVVKHVQKKLYESQLKNNQSTWVDEELTFSGYFRDSDGINNCHTSGAQIKKYKTSKSLINKQIGFFSCYLPITNNPKIKNFSNLDNGINYIFKKDPKWSMSDISWYLKKGVIKKNQDNPILYAEVVVEKDKKNSYSFLILKSEVHPNNYNGYLQISFYVNERRRDKAGANFFRRTKSRFFELSQINNLETKKLFDTLYKVEKHYKKFEKNKFKALELNKEITNYLLSIKPSSEWIYFTNSKI